VGFGVDSEFRVEAAVDEETEADVEDEAPDDGGSAFGLIGEGLGAEVEIEGLHGWEGGVGSWK